jgi:hypothetical protein
MRLTKDANILMNYFSKNNCITPIRQTRRTNNILTRLYDDIKKGVSYIHNLKSKMGSSFYNLKVTKITNISQIPKPSTFPPNAFPPEIRRHIDENSIHSLTYHFKIFDRNINILFLIEDGNVETLIYKYNNYVDYMLVWLFIVNKYSSKSCANNMKIFIYHTSLLKMIPSTNISVLEQTHVNTGFTRTCSKVSEIVIYRKEEWFKVFIHESFHNFALDFSNIDSSLCKTQILNIFPVNSEVNLEESYSEFWARIMNSLFCAFIHMKNKNDVTAFLKNAELFINFERIYSFFQAVKVLNFMGLTYTDLYKKTALAENMRKTLFKENTNILSYYIITLILLNNYQDLLVWCDKNNTHFINFKKTTTNLYSYCDFIEKKHKTKNLLDNIVCAETMLYKLTKQKKKDTSFITNNLRMTICELG